MEYARHHLLYCTILCIIAWPIPSFAQGGAIHGGAAHGALTPSGFGAWGNMVFAGIGSTNPQAYSDEGDLIGVAGVGLGNPTKIVGVQLQIYMLDVSDQDRYSLGFKVHKYFGYGTSIAIGAQNLLAFGKEFREGSITDAPSSYYVVLSHDLRYNYSPENPLSKASFSIGAGTGRYSEKSPSDIAAGRGESGTYVFGALGYSIFPSLSYYIEWSGINLHTGISFSHFFKTVPVGFSISVGAADLTRYSGDQVRFISSIAISYRRR